jgi:hypothetical protein
MVGNIHLCLVVNLPSDIDLNQKKEKKKKESETKPKNQQNSECV